MGIRFLRLSGLAATVVALLLLPGAEVGRAQAVVDIRCVGFEQGGDRKALLHLHNADVGDASAQLQWLSPDGTIRESLDLVIPSGTTLDEVRRGDAIGITAKVTADKQRLVVDGEMVYDDPGDELHRRTITCLRVQ